MLRGDLGLIAALCHNSSVSACEFSIAKLIRFERAAGLAVSLASLLLAPARLRARGGELSPLRSAQVDAEIQNRPTELLARDLSAALTEGQEKREEAILDEILERPQIDLDLLMALGVQFAEHERYAEAARVFARCVRDHPSAFEAHYNLALTELAEGRQREAQATLKATPHGSADQELALLYLRGKIEHSLGDNASAERDLTAAFSRAPQQENYALDLGFLYLQQHSYQRAERVFERGVSSNPKSPFLLLGLSLAQFLGGREGQSVESAKNLLKVQPDFSPAYLLAAFVLQINGTLEEAEKFAARGLALPHPMPYLYYLHAALLLKRQSREYDRILSELAEANREIPGCALCSLAASKVHQAEGEIPSAIADLQRAVRFDPNFADAWYRLAALYQQAGRQADAARARDKFERLKADQEDRDREMLRKVLLRSLSGEEDPASSQ
jgi:tetratricopeptide (TPR) repeat protein